jgi:hypothetical protein
MKKIIVAIAFLGFIACKPKNQVDTQPNTSTETKTEETDTLKLQLEKDSIEKANTQPVKDAPKEK